MLRQYRGHAHSSGANLVPSLNRAPNAPVKDMGKERRRRRECAYALRTFTVVAALSSKLPQRARAASCCVNSTSGAFFDSCVCLVDNAQTVEQNLTQGHTALYHWVLEKGAAELVKLEPRGNLTFKVTQVFRASIEYARGA